MGSRAQVDRRRPHERVRPTILAREHWHSSHEPRPGDVEDDRQSVSANFEQDIRES